MNLKIKISNLNAKNKIILIIVLFFVFCLTLLYIIILPNIKRIEYLQKSIINQKIEAEKNRIRQQNIFSINKKVKQIESQVDTINSIFINTNKKLEFITTLEGIADKNNVEQSINLNVDTNSAKQSHQEIPLTLNISASYNNLINYLIDLESLDYYINIHSLNLSKSSPAKLSKEGASVPLPHYSMTLLANTFWR